LANVRVFIAGEGKGSYSIADMSCWPWVSRFEWQEIDLNSYPNIKDWYIYKEYRDKQMTYWIIALSHSLIKVLRFNLSK